MDLVFVNPHISIQEFDKVKLPNFVVLTGLNGSGKTHLLKAINAGDCQLDDFRSDEIQYFNYQNFIAQNDSGQNTVIIEQMVRQGFDEFEQHFLPTIKYIYQNLALEWRQSKNYSDANIFYENIQDFWKAKFRNRTQQEHLESYRLAITAWRETPENIPKTSQSPAIWSVIQKSSRPPHLIDQETFRNLFQPIMDAGSILGFSLSTLFTKYKISEFNWCHNEFSAGRAVSVQKLQSTYRSRTPPPWIAINDLLADMGRMAGARDTFRFEVTTPEDQTIQMEDVQNYTFLAQLKNKTTGAICNFEQLSSGEKVLLALACSIFYANDLLMLPRVLLLDEVDASLHPSMIRTLLNAIQDAFVNKGTKVIIATHSPTTAALAPENSLYFVKSGSKRKKIIRKSKKEVLTRLSEGFLTFDEGLEALKFSGEKLVIFTEGHNRIIFKRYLELEDIQGVTIIDTLDSKTSDNQLPHYFNAISALGLNRPFLFNWDCDAESHASRVQENKDVFKFVIPKNGNNKYAKKGIENAFSENILEPYCENNPKDGSTNRAFCSNKKKEFAYHIARSENIDDFSGLVSLKDKIEEILRSTNQ
jgi:energy-coupling factor transporter ATP-binding protein EcfA2